MNDDIQLEYLNALELNILLGHLRLGIDHLKKYLSDDQLSELLDYGWLKTNQYQKIKSDGAEKRGNIAIMVNTVFTCVVGGWLASISFIGISPATNKCLLLFILIFAGVASGYFGYISFKKVRLEAKQALNEQKLINLRFKILDLIKEKRQQNVSDMADYLNNILVDFFKEDPSNVKNTLPTLFDSKKEFIQWFNDLNKKINIEIKPLCEKIVYKVFIKNIKNIKLKLKKAIKTNIDLVEHQNQVAEKNDNSKKETWFSLQENESKSFIHVLTDPAMTLPKIKIKKNHG